MKSAKSTVFTRLSSVAITFNVSLASFRLSDVAACESFNLAAALSRLAPASDGEQATRECQCRLPLSVCSK